jgi:hypothetical protein
MLRLQRQHKHPAVAEDDRHRRIRSLAIDALITVVLTQRRPPEAIACLVLGSTKA